MRTILKVSNDIKLITNDQIDFHITKQLSYVLYTLTERAFHEHVITVENEDFHNTVYDIIDATEKLIKSNFVTRQARANFVPGV